MTTKAELSNREPARQRAPGLPGSRKWQSMTRRWWQAVWRSPMAKEFLKVDLHGLYRLAVLVDEFWSKPSTKLAGEIRQQQAAYGLTPIDRRRLQWEVKRVEGKGRQAAKPRLPAGDPRAFLKPVK